MWAFFYFILSDCWIDSWTLFNSGCAYAKLSKMPERSAIPFRCQIYTDPWFRTVWSAFIKDHGVKSLDFRSLSQSPPTDVNLPYFTVQLDDLFKLQDDVLLRLSTGQRWVQPLWGEFWLATFIDLVTSMILMTFWRPQARCCNLSDNHKAKVGLLILPLPSFFFWCICE